MDEISMEESFENSDIMDESQGNVWDEIDMNFDANETGNFGPREEIGSALYQVDTVATISPRDKEIAERPHVQCRVHEEYTAVAVDQSLSLFGDRCAQFLTTFKFESEITALEFTEDGLFLMVAEQLGKLHFVDIPLHISFYSHCLDVPVRNIVFTEGNNNGVCDMYVLCEGDAIWKFGNLQTTSLHQALCDQDLDAIVEIKSSLKVETIRTTTPRYPACLAPFYGEDGLDRLVVAGLADDEDGDTLCLLGPGETDRGFVSYDSAMGFGPGVIKCQLTTSDRPLMVTLDDDRHLSLWDLRSLLLLHRYSHVSVRDFTLLDSGEDTRSRFDMKLVMLTVPVDGVSHFQVRRLHSMEIIYSLQVSQYTYLAKCPTFQEELYIIEGSSDTDDVTDHVTELRMRCVAEVDPDTRLYRLLRREKFDGAEKFAREYQLNLQLVYTTKANHLLSCACDGMEGADPSMMEDLFSCLKLVQNIGALMDQCTKAALPSYKLTHKLLTYLQTRAVESSPPVDPARMDTLARVLYRLHTFKMAFGEQYYSADTWERFSTCDVISTVQKLLLQRQLKAAFIIWNRHIASHAGEITEQVVVQLLDSVPSDSPSHRLISWLENDFIPVLARHCPASLVHLAQWIEAKTLSMEQAETENGPGDGLRFAQILPDVLVKLGTQAGQFTCTLPAEFTNHTSDTSCTAFVHLNSLINDLRKLLEFHTKYQCPLTLHEFRKETTESLAFRLLDKARTPTAIRAVIREQLSAYIDQYKLDQDQILYLHMQNFVKKISGDGSNLCWESLAVTVIDHISDVQYKCKAVVVVMKKAYMPWSQTIQTLVNNALNYKHPLVSLVKEQNNFSRIRQVLVEYGLKDILPEQLDTAMLIQYIINKDKPGGVKDALTFTNLVDHIKPSHVYTTRMNFLVKHERLSECLSLYCSLTHEEMLECGLRFIYGALHKLEAQVLFATEAAQLECLRVTEAAVSLINVLLPNVKSDVTLYKQLQDDVKVLAAVAALQREFGEFMSPSKYKQETERAKVMYTYLKLHYTGQSLLKNKLSINGERKMASSEEEHFTLIYRLADLLLISREELRGRLAVEAAKSGSVETAVRLSKELASCNLCPATSLILYQVSHVLHGLLASGDVTDPALPATILDMVNQATSYCSPDLLADCLELQKCVSMTTRVCRQTDTATVAKGDERQDGFSIDPYTNWSYSPCYNEEVHVLDAKEALSHISKYQEICLPEAGGRGYPYSQYRPGGQSRLVLEPGESALDDKPEPKFREPTSRDSTDHKRQTRSAKHGDPQSTSTGSKTSRSTSRNKAGSRSSTPTNLNSTDTPSTETSPTDTLEQPKPEPWEPKQPVDSRVVEIRRFAESCGQYLLENGQSQVAAELSVNCMILASQHLTVQNMGFYQHKSTKYIFDLESKELATWREQWTPQFDKLIYSLINKLLNHQFIDQTLLLTYLDTLPSAKCLPIITKCAKSLGHSYKKLMDLCEVGMECSRLMNVRESAEQLEELRLKSYWGHKLSKYKISFKSAFQNSPNAKEDVVLQLVRSVSSDVIKEYFTAFKLNRKRIFPDVLESLLLSDPGSGDADSFPHYQRAQLAIQNISDPKTLEAKLWKILNKLSVYDYPRIGFVLNELSNVAPAQRVDKGLHILRFLTSYKRVSPPGEYEMTLIEENTSEEDQMICGGRMLPVVSQERLPFHVLYSGQPLKVITKELTFDTVSEWVVALSNDPKLPADHLYMLTIQNCVTQHIANQNAASGVTTNQSAASSTSNQKTRRLANWNRDNVDEKFYDNLYDLLKRMSDCAQAVVCASWVVKELPAGAEKVHALEWCVKMTELWVVACPDDSPDKEKARKTHAKFSTYCKKASTEQILYQNDMAEPELLALLSNPVKLIFELYDHPSVLDRIDYPTGVYPNIHLMASQIAIIHRLAIDEIQMHLTNQWLFDQSAGEIDLSLTFNFKMEESEEESEACKDDSNLKRLLYLLENVDTPTILKLLINSAFTEAGSSGSKFTTTSQLRCLHCALSLADTTLIENVSGKTAAEIRKRMCTIQYIIELEKLMIKMTCRVFEETNKEQLAKMIWKQHSREKRTPSERPCCFLARPASTGDEERVKIFPVIFHLRPSQAVMLVSVLCVDYAIYDTVLWTGVIRQLTALDLVDHLEVVLLRISSVVTLYHVDGLQRAWQQILTAHLNNLTKPVNEQCWNGAMRPLYLYVRCPVIDGLDLDEIITRYIQLDMLPCALHFSLIEGRDCSILLENSDLIELLDCVGKMNLDWYQPDAMYCVKQCVYQYVREHRLYNRLLSSQYFLDLVTYLVEEDDIDDLMVSSVKSNRIGEAEKLVCLYNKMRENHRESFLTPRHQLEHFLETRRLSVLIPDSD